MEQPPEDQMDPLDGIFLRLNFGKLSAGVEDLVKCDRDGKIFPTLHRHLLGLPALPNPQEEAEEQKKRLRLEHLSSLLGRALETDQVGSLFLLVLFLKTTDNLYCGHYTKVLKGYLSKVLPSQELGMREQPLLLEECVEILLRMDSFHNHLKNLMGNRYLSRADLRELDGTLVSLAFATDLNHWFSFFSERVSWRVLGYCWDLHHNFDRSSCLPIVTLLRCLQNREIHSASTQDLRFFEAQILKFIPWLLEKLNQAKDPAHTQDKDATMGWDARKQVILLYESRLIDLLDWSCRYDFVQVLGLVETLTQEGKMEVLLEKVRIEGVPLMVHLELGWPFRKVPQNLSPFDFTCFCLRKGRMDWIRKHVTKISNVSPKFLLLHAQPSGLNFFTKNLIEDPEKLLRCLENSDLDLMALLPWKAEDVGFMLRDQRISIALKASFRSWYSWPTSNWESYPKPLIPFLTHHYGFAKEEEWISWLSFCLQPAELTNDNSDLIGWVAEHSPGITSTLLKHFLGTDDLELLTLLFQSLLERSLTVSRVGLFLAVESLVEEFSVAQRGLMSQPDLLEILVQKEAVLTKERRLWYPKQNLPKDHPPWCISADGEIHEVRKDEKGAPISLWPYPIPYLQEGEYRFYRFYQTVLTQGLGQDCPLSHLYQLCFTANIPKGIHLSGGPFTSEHGMNLLARERRALRHLQGWDVSLLALSSLVAEGYLRVCLEHLKPEDRENLELWGHWNPPELVRFLNIQKRFPLDLRMRCCSLLYRPDPAYLFFSSKAVMEAIWHLLT